MIALEHLRVGRWVEPLRDYMPTWKVVALTIGLLIVAALTVTYAFLVSEGPSARKKPSNAEYGIANRALAISIPSKARARKNPIQETPDVLAGAKQDYKEHCVVCHAEDGSGKTDTAHGMSPEVPDLRADHIQKLTDGELFYIIQNGVRFTGMPAWDLANDHIWRLVALIRQLPKLYPPR
jgi:mono/diheme cytochrome c family protein